MERKNKHCHFCVTNTKWIDYKDTNTLRKFVSLQAKILPKRRTGVCAKHQREPARAIKRARYMSLMEYTTLE